MPTAIQTSKRKFHRLLENLSAVPSDPLAEQQQANAVKRQRLDPRGRTSGSSDSVTREMGIDRPSLRYVARVNSTRPTQPTQNRGGPMMSAAPRASPGAGTATAEIPEQNYSPWSHTAFLSRLATYSAQGITAWTPKPGRINEVAFAKHGWTLDSGGENTVVCRGGCGARIIVALRPARKDADGAEILGSEDLSAEVPEQLVEVYEDKLTDGHADDCLWRVAGACKSDVYRLPIARPSIWRPTLQARLASFEAAGALPPPTRLVYPVNVDEIATQLPADFLDAQKPLDTRHEALAFALMGWQLSRESTPEYPVASCGACFRRLGLWLYLKNDDSASKGEDEPSSPTSAMRLDLQANHRDYCPWINASSQAMPGQLAGLSAWQILVRVILNDAEFRGRSSQNEEELGGPNDEATTTNATSASENATQQSDETANSQVVFATLPTAEERAATEEKDRVRTTRLRQLLRSFGRGSSSKGGDAAKRTPTVV